ncbi:hypothetical protein D023_0410B, partial [Vibrio parahaemolyticus 3256]
PHFNLVQQWTKPKVTIESSKDKAFVVVHFHLERTCANRLTVKILRAKCLWQ